jgi:hypothetical protein
MPQTEPEGGQRWIDLDHAFLLDHAYLLDRAERAEAKLGQVDDLLRRLSEWDVMQSTGDGTYWKSEIARAREALRSLDEEKE